MYVRIPGNGIAMVGLAYIKCMLGGDRHVSASIHSVYARIPGKGIAMFRLAYIQCMLGSRVRGSPYIESYRMMMTIPLKGVSKMG